MKTIILALTLFTYNGDFCLGWNDGYRDGYCNNHDYGCFAPTPPPCPSNYNNSGYSTGYQRGFHRGLNDNK